jgi:tape measure domain-containing protein
MAETLGTAELILTADATRLQAGLQAGRQSVEQYNRSTTASFERAGRAQINTLDGINARLNQLRSQRGGAVIGSAQFRSINAEIAQIERLQQQAERGRGGPGLLGGLLGAVSVGSVVAGLKSAVDAAAELEGITRRLSNTLGAQGAQGALGFTRGLANELGLSFKTLAGGFASFTAAASAANVPLEQQKALFSAVARSGQALGLSNDAINGSLLALQQVAAKGTVQMEELRGQLGERLPTAFAATARGLGISSRELIKLVESGQLTSQQFFPALTKGLNELNSGASGVPTATQNIESLKNAWDELQTSFGQSLLGDVVNGVKTLTQALQGAQVEAEAYDLTRSFSLPQNDARALVGYLQSIRSEFGLTNEQSKNLLSDAIAQVGGSKNAFGQLVLSGQQLADVMGLLRERADRFTGASRAAAEARDQEAKDAAKALADEDARKKALLETTKRLSTANRDQLDAMVRNRKLQGDALTFAQEQLAIERARRDAALALGDLQVAQEIGKPEGIKAAAGALLEAGAGIGVAIEESTRRAAERLKEARDALKDAAEALRGRQLGFAAAVGKSFAIATNEQRANARQLLVGRIREAERDRAFDPARVATRYGLEQTGAGLNLQSLTFRQLERLSGEVGTLADAENELKDSMNDLTLSLNQLAKRKWEVQVNVRNNANGTTAVDYVNNLR